MKHLFQSFSARLTFYILALTTLIFVGIGIVFSTYSQQREEKQAMQYTTALQQNVVLKVDHDLAMVEAAMNLIQGQTEQELGQPEAMASILERALQTNPLLKGVGIAFRPGFYGQGERRLLFLYVYRNAGTGAIEHINVPQVYGDYTQRKWFKHAMRTGQRRWTDPYIDYNNRRDMMTSYVLPSRDTKGEVYAALLADVQLTDLTDELNKLQPYEGCYSFILSHEGKYVAHPDTSLLLNDNVFQHARELHNDELAATAHNMLAGKTGAVRTSVDNHDALLCYAPMPRAGWSIASVVPYRSIMHDLGSTTLTVLAILIGGLLVLLLCIRLLVTHLTRPVKQLTGAAYLIAKGNFDVPLPEVDTKDEFRQLHDAFDHMQRSLNAYIHELETTTRAKERIESELHIARSIQMSLVPKIFSPFPNCEELELFASLRPAKEVGGDFFDFFLRDGQLKFVIGDVSGKGIPASLVMAITRTLFRIISNTTDSPAETVTQLNNALAKDNDACMFVTFYCGNLDLSTGKLTFCNAGHNAPLIISPEGKACYQQRENNLPLGVMDGYEFQNEETTLPKGAAMLLYTDGLTEAENAQKELFGEERTLAAAEEFAHDEAHVFIEHLTAKLSEFVGEAEQSDDLTLLCFRLNDKADVQPEEKSLHMTNSLDELHKLHTFVEDLAATYSLSPSLANSLNLALEEALVNVVQYAYPSGTTGDISLTARTSADKRALVFELRDKGIAFNPLEAPSPDITLGVEDRPIGGLGIFLVTQLMDSVAYQRTAAENVLTMTKSIED